MLPPPPPPPRYLLSLIISLSLISLISAQRLTKAQYIDSCFENDSLLAPKRNFQKDISRFSLKLFRNLIMGEKGDSMGNGGIGNGENMVMSPYSVYSALLMTYLASGGRTQQELATVLKFHSKIGTFTDWQIIEDRLTRSGTNSRQKRQSSATNASQNQQENSNSRSSQSKVEGVRTVVKSSSSSVEQCATDENGDLRCTTRNIDNGVPSSSSSGGGSSSSSSSSSSSVSNSLTESCTTGSSGVRQCTTEICTTAADSVDMTCTTDICTTQPGGVEECNPSATSRATRTQRSTQTTEFSTKNWMYVSKNLPLKKCLPKFIPEISPIDFTPEEAAAQTINAAVHQATKGEISTLVEPQDLTGAQFMLLNAVYFKGFWQRPFPVQDTRSAPFYSSSDLSTKVGDVPMMHLTGPFPYAASTPLNATALELSYTGDYSLLLLLPNESERLEAVVEKLSYKKLNDTLTSLRESDMQITVPRFTIRSHLSGDLKKALVATGLGNLFNNKLELSLITPTLLDLHSVIHQAAIQVDEEGTTFAASTGLIGTRVGHTKFTCNRPFIFLLLNRLYNLPIAAGVYRKP